MLPLAIPGKGTSQKTVFNVPYGKPLKESMFEGCLQVMVKYKTMDLESFNSWQDQDLKS